MCRQNIYLEELKNFYAIWTKNADDLEIFSDFLDIVVINLNETDKEHELSSGTLNVRPETPALLCINKRKLFALIVFHTVTP